MHYSGGSCRAHFDKGGAKDFDHIIRVHTHKIASFTAVDIDLPEIEYRILHIYRYFHAGTKRGDPAYLIP
jgi:hypothetical protein